MVSGAREGPQDVAALAGVMGEAGEGLAGRAMSQWNGELQGLDAGGEPVDGHADLGPEARRDAG